uniref:Putative sphingosine kinase involved in sphingolipid metabolism n=1 Tax=Nyssomyia neivai TaxID=330878 RepID=A0A1L8DZ76_9DIPT
MESHEAVLLAALHVGKKRVRAILHAGAIAWEPSSTKKGNQRHQVSLADVVTVLCNGATFTLVYGRRRRGTHEWQLQRTTFVAADATTAEAWTQEARRQLEAQTHRPRRILVFVNPFGGRRAAPRIYKRRVQPLLELAGIETEVIVSERSQQIRETLLEATLDNYDGIVCVGGDGTFSELFNGLVARECHDSGIPMTSALLPRPRIPLAVIPGGSTNTVAFCMHGTDDPTTCAIHLVLGQRAGLDLCSTTSSDPEGVRLYASVLSYGYLGDIAKESERYRWMGPRRYEYSGLRKFLMNRGYRGEVSVLLDHTDPAADAAKCLEGCERCSAPVCDPDTPPVSDTETPWQVIRGKFLMVNGANISCACRRSPSGMSPSCHLGDGCVDVIIVHHTHMFNNLRLLLRLSSRKGSVAQLPFVRVLRARGFHFRPHDAAAGGATGSQQPIAPSGKQSVWNCDGEVLTEGEATIKPHRQLVTVFRRPLVDPEEAKCAFCS